MNEDNWSNAIDPDEAPEAAFESSDAEPAVHETVFDEDGSYRIVRPQTDDRSYTDASYREAADTEIPPRYYTPDPPRAKAPKSEKKGGFMKAACLALARRCPPLPGEAWIAASGVFERAHLEEAGEAGFAACLVGTALMAGGRPGEALARLLGNASAQGEA